MHNALSIAKTGMAAQDAKMTAISNNLANVNTVGFKQDTVVFADLFYSIDKNAGTETADLNQHPTGIQLGNGVRVAGTQKIFTQGNINTTDQQYDLAINGDGFLQVTGGDGDILYTRNGQLQVNADGVLVTNQGFAIEPEITIPDNATKVSISQDGIVQASIAGQTDSEELGQITLAKFMNPSGLRPLGDNMLGATDASGDAIELVPGQEGVGIIQQGALEGSNVQIVSQMVDMIQTQRGYEMNAKIMSASDEMLQYIAQQS